MSIERLLDVISGILKEKGLSERKALLNADISIDFIRDMRRNGNMPKSDKLIKLAKSLGVPIEIFLEAIEKDIPRRSESREVTLIPGLITTVYIRGEVQAGRWRTALEWPRQDWIPLAIPVPEKYKNFPWYALYVRGDSMNLVFPEGTVVIIVNFSDLGKKPENGDCVVAIRRDSLTDTFEATVKVVQIRKDRRVFLWPRSDNPEFTKPIILPKMTQKYQNNGLDGDSSATPDLLIQGLVIGSFRPAQKVEIR